MDKNNVGISLIIPVFNEESSIREVFKRSKEVLSGTKKAYEILFVDDGSFDNTNSLLAELSNVEPVLKVLRLDENQGQQKALIAGLKLARGEVKIIMDGDLQYLPEDIPNLLAGIEGGYDVVNGWREDRADGILRRIASRFSNWLISRITGVKLNDFNSGFKAIKGDVAMNMVKEYPENRLLLFRVLKEAKKFGEVKVRHNTRKSGGSRYSFFMLVKYFFRSIIQLRS